MNKYRLVLVTFSLFTALSANAKTSIGYDSVESALTALKSKQGAQFSQQGGWTIVAEQEDGDYVLWSFTPTEHDAHPAAVKRKIVEKDKQIHIEMTALCQASKSQCDALIEEFKLLNDKIRQSMSQQ
ncbi:molecular chaperone DnaJ [Thalassotalea sp. HSM 43]|uniref:molecular chaperone DnaJ n=1 Tax=Thalassotalea sp. HSM 43 TaxID=2552945 RepID=UPI001080D7DB|nr:molecular chaperone DnaJ [Thalassotalea sp. HSM 43]QBY05804.1 molecular chaperone DnaJ [Thalassotalea sp. HSM 43]